MITKDTPKKLFLLDAFALIYRAHFAFAKNPRISSKGLNTSAIFGFTNTLLEILNKEKPTHIAIVFDTPEQTARHVEFEAYKAHREEMPDDLRASLPYIHQLIEGIVEEEKKVNDNRKNQNLNIFIIALTLIQALSIFYTLFNDLPEKSPYLFELFLSINLLIIFISFIWFIRFKFPTSEPNNLNQNNHDNT